MIDIGYLSGTSVREAWLRMALAAAGELRVVLRAREIRELGQRRMQPAVLIWDLGTTDLPGNGELEELERRLPGMPALLAIGDDPAIADWIATYPAAWGWMLEDPEDDQLVAAVSGLASGLTVLDQGAMEHVLAFERSVVTGDERRESDGPHLTDRERDILALIARGFSNRQMAENLGISENTVKYHVASLYDRLGVGSRAEALARAVRYGLLAV